MRNFCQIFGLVCCLVVTFAAWVFLPGCVKEDPRQTSSHDGEIVFKVIDSSGHILLTRKCSWIEGDGERTLSWSEGGSDTDHWIMFMPDSWHVEAEKTKGAEGAERVER